MLSAVTADSHHAEGRVDPKVDEGKNGFLVLDTPEHVDSDKLIRKSV
jgi:hypothetical protein